MNLVEFSHYDELSGRIRSVGRVPQDFLEYQDKPFVVGAADLERDYVKAGVVTRRPSLKLSLVGAVLKGVPAGATVVIDVAEYTADGSDIELNFSVPGEYRIRVLFWPYLDGEVTYAYQP